MVVDIITFRSCQSSLFLPPEVSTSPSRVSAIPARRVPRGRHRAHLRDVERGRTTFAESPAPFVLKGRDALVATPIKPSLPPALGALSMPRDAVVADLEDERDERQRREEDGEEGTEGRPAESDASDERRGRSFAKMRDTRGSSESASKGSVCWCGVPMVVDIEESDATEKSVVQEGAHHFRWSLCPPTVCRGLASPRSSSRLPDSADAARRSGDVRIIAARPSSAPHFVEEERRSAPLPPLAIPADVITRVGPAAGLTLYGSTSGSI